MIRHILTVSAGTLISRVLGFLRDTLIAALLGAGPVADAFLVALQFINVARRALSEGSLNAALVPIYLRLRDSEGAIAATAFAGQVMGSLCLILIGIAVVFTGLMPFVISVMAPGFIGHQTMQLAIDDARLMMPYFAFVGPITVMMGVLNAERRFLLTAFSPVLFNLMMIAIILSLLLWHHDAQTSATIIAGAVGVAGCFQMLVLIQRRPWRSGLAAPIRISFNPQIRAFYRKAVPGMIANSGPQFLIVAGAIIASGAPAAVSWLYFANRLIELPLGMVGVAMGTVLMPEFTHAIQNDDHDALTHAQSRGVELALGLVLPATLGLMLLSEPIIGILFQHGAFTATDTVATAEALSVLALGLPAYVLVKVLSPAFFAREDTRTPLLATLAGIASAVIAGLLVSHRFGVSGIAASISLGAWICALILTWRGASSFGFSIDETARMRLPRIVLCAAIMGLTLFTSQYFVAPLTENAPFFPRLTILGGMIAAGISFYGLLLDLFDVVSWGEAFGDLRDRSPRGK
ncbi:murein biosynthesis integral membrane protein MurJ [Afipia felis]|uniref:Probable lipid II flippase MurJ n=2 Tax=Afipia felis TaxID=1035 RepID=A0A380W1Z3_AFIFE|nr:murein biosynthesis integral membrane protein MurJ [Afipia felis]EKS30045.1 integral membrane protein MviN [Afipia felis ATCC 53690]SUU74790.1 integral membrane protein MviN [Afipia felis]SUU82856.1 integral membrane protein MviN [Afipia felis]